MSPEIFVKATALLVFVVILMCVVKLGMVLFS